MISLYLDSSNIDLCVGIADDKVIDAIMYPAWQTQSEYMVRDIDKLLTKHQLTRNDIKDVVVTIGPGSYTGIRIALTIAKVICLALNVPLYALSSLVILSNYDVPSICLLNARSKRSYIGVYQKGETLLKDQIMSNEEVLKYIEEHPDYLVCGDTSYLNIEGYITNTIMNMHLLKDKAIKYDDALVVKPVYLKD